MPVANEVKKGETVANRMLPLITITTTVRMIQAAKGRNSDSAVEADFAVGGSAVKGEL